MGSPRQVKMKFNIVWKKYKFVIVAAVIILGLMLFYQTAFKSDIDVSVNARSAMLAYEDYGDVDWYVTECIEKQGTTWGSCTDPEIILCLNWAGMTSAKCQDLAFGCTDGPHSCEYFVTGVEGTINPDPVTTDVPSDLEQSSETSAHIYSPGTGQIAADIVLCNPTSEVVEGIVSLEVITPSEAQTRTAFIGAQFSCEHDEDVQLRYSLQPSECTVKTTLTSTGLSAGTYTAHIYTLDQCCIEEGGCEAIPPIGWDDDGKYTKSLSIQGAGISCSFDGENYVVGNTLCVSDSTKRVCGNDGEWDLIDCRSDYTCYNDNCRPEISDSIIPDIELPDFLKSSWVLWGGIFGVILVLFFIFSKPKSRPPRQYQRTPGGLR